MRFGLMARQRRIAKRVSLRDTARELGWSAAYVSDIELSNRNPPDAEKVRQWAEYLDEDEDEWLKIAQLDTVLVSVPVDRNPKKAEFALLVARRIGSMTDEEIDQYTASLKRGEDE